MLNGAGTDPDADTTLNYEWNFSYDGVAFDVDSKNQSPPLVLTMGPATRTVALRAVDKGVPPTTSLISTATFRQNRSAIQNSVPITNIYDVDKVGCIHATDTALFRQNQPPIGSIVFFTAPVSLQLAGFAALPPGNAAVDAFFAEFERNVGLEAASQKPSVFPAAFVR